MYGMTSHSRITAQGQISVPAEVRRQLGVGPGSVLEWEEKGGEIVVRRVSSFSSADVHSALFPEGAPGRKSANEIKKGIRARVRKRHARG